MPMRKKLIISEKVRDIGDVTMDHYWEVTKFQRQELHTAPPDENINMMSFLVCKKLIITESERYWGEHSQLVVNELSKVSNGNFNDRSKSSHDRRPAFSLKVHNFNSSSSLIDWMYKRDSTMESSNVVEDSYLHEMNYR